MQSDTAESGGLFRSAFLEKGLVTFAECADHYGSFDTDELLAEMRLLFSAPMLAIPFAVSGTRYFALVDALIRRTADEPALADEQRARLVNICIDICAYVRNRTAERRREAYDLTLATTLDAVRWSGAFPQVADLVANGTRDYAGRFLLRPRERHAGGRRSSFASEQDAA